MNTESVLARMLPAREEVIKAVVHQVVESSASVPLYDLEEQTQAALPRIGQVLLQGVVTAQGAGVVGPTRPCPCGVEQHYHDQARRLSVQTSVGLIRLERRAAGSVAKNLRGLAWACSRACVQLRRTLQTGW